MINTPSSSTHLLLCVPQVQQRLPNVCMLKSRRTDSHKALKNAVFALPTHLKAALKQCAIDIIKGNRPINIVDRLLKCHNLDKISTEVTHHILQYDRMNSGGILGQCRTFKTRAGPMTAEGYNNNETTKKFASIFPKKSRFGKAVEKLAPMPANSQKLDALLQNTEDEKVKENLKQVYYDGYMQGVVKMSGQPTGVKKEARWSLEKVLWLGVAMAILYYLYTAGGLRLPGSRKFEVDEETTVGVSFDDVRGIDEAREDLQEVVDYLRNPDKYSALGARLPKGVLLVGIPGTGKTLLARAIAGEAGVPFFRASGSEFDEMLVGLGAARMRQLFEAAKVKAPCVIFIDEIDSVGATRVSTSVHPYANQTINQMLNEMDGFERNEGIIVIGATNRREDLDKALLRPGRFDMEINVMLPDKDGRKDIFTLYLDKVLVGDDVDIESLAKRTVGLTGAEIENLVNTATLRAATDGYQRVQMMHLEEAFDRIAMGRNRKGGRLPDEECNRITAYHEAGHTLVAYYSPDATPLHKVTIMPRGHSLGHTSFIPGNDQFYRTKAQLLASLDAAMGGRVGEEIIFGTEKVTTGGGNDFRGATIIAEAMVKEYGMSSLGPRDFTVRSHDHVTPAISPALQEAIDNEIKSLLNESYNRAKHILQTHAKEHHALAKALLEHETLDAAQITRVIQGKPPILPEEKDNKVKLNTTEAMQVISKLPKGGSGNAIHRLR